MANLPIQTVPIATSSSDAISHQDKMKAIRAKQAAEDFEAVYIAEMLKPMFETVEVDDMFGGGKGEEIFRGILVQEMGKSIARQGGIGLADHVRAQLLQNQER